MPKITSEEGREKLARLVFFLSGLMKAYLNDKKKTSAQYIFYHRLSQKIGNLEKATWIMMRSLWAGAPLLTLIKVFRIQKESPNLSNRLVLLYHLAELFHTAIDDYLTIKRGYSIFDEETDTRAKDMWDIRLGRNGDAPMFVHRVAALLWLFTAVTRATAVIPLHITGKSKDERITLSTVQLGADILLAWRHFITILSTNESNSSPGPYSPSRSRKSVELVKGGSNPHAKVQMLGAVSALCALLR